MTLAFHLPARRWPGPEGERATSHNDRNPQPHRAKQARA